MKQLTELVNKLVFFTDKKGKVLGREMDGAIAGLTMEYIQGDIRVHFSHARSGLATYGPLTVQVSKGKETLLYAECAMGVGPTKIEKIKDYMPGALEKACKEIDGFSDYTIGKR